MRIIYVPERDRRNHYPPEPTSFATPSGNYKYVQSESTGEIFGIDFKFLTTRPIGSYGWLFDRRYKFKFINEQLGAPNSIEHRDTKFVKTSTKIGENGEVEYHYRAERYLNILI